MSVKRRSDNSERIRKFRITMILGYALIISAVILFICVLTMKKTDDVLKSKVSSMTSALNVQMKMNMDSYLSKMETTATLVFASETVYQYDATDSGMDEYEALSTEKEISDELYSLCLIENYVDFGIVYSNNHTVGKVSNGTKSLFGDSLYTDLEAMVNRQRTSDGWSAGYHDDFKRIYYVKRVNEHAVLVISVYASELESVFEHPGGIEDITVRLTDYDNRVIYSSADGETGEVLPDEINTRVAQQSSLTLLDSEYLISVNSCGDSWKVICSVPTKVILKEKNDVQLFIALISFLAAIIAITISVLFSVRIVTPVNTMVTALNKKAHIDQLTGILNKRSFEECTEAAIRYAGSKEKYALILLDVDNFKGVNDTLGHAYGDRVLAEIGDILRAVFRQEDYLGRLGGDEFAVFLNIPLSMQQDYQNFVKSKCAELCSAFHNNYTGDDGTYKVSASIGAALYPAHGATFGELYRLADSALYNSKSQGKDMYTIYTEDLK